MVTLLKNREAGLRGGAAPGNLTDTFHDPNNWKGRKSCIPRLQFLEHTPLGELRDRVLGSLSLHLSGIKIKIWDKMVAWEAGLMPQYPSPYTYYLPETPSQ